MSLKQKIREMTITCFAANGDQIEMIDPKDVEKAIDDVIKQIRQKIEEMILGRPAVFAEETEYEKGYSKGYYDAKEQIREILSVLEGEGEKLSDEEIKDVAIAEKEFASGKTKTFKKAEDFIAELHSSRKEEKEKEAKPT